MELVSATEGLKEQVEQLRSRKRTRDDGSPLSEAEIESLLSEIEKKLEQLELCAKEGKGVLLRRLTRQAVQPIQVETSHTPDSILKLNVGGTEFLVSKDLIMSEDWMLSAMFSGRHQLQPRADGAFFIERDPTFFPYILNYLRDKESAALPSGKEEENALMEEVDYYQLKGLGRLLRGDFAQDFAIGLNNVRIKEEENKVRSVFLNTPDSPTLNEPFLHLIDVFDERNVKTFVQEEGAKIPLMFEKRRNLDIGSRSICENLDTFKAQFDAMTGLLFDGLNWDNIFVAGGSVVASVLPIPKSYAQLAERSAVNRKVQEPPPVLHEDDEVAATFGLRQDKIVAEKESERDRNWCYYNGVTAGWFYTQGKRGTTSAADTGFQNSDIDVFLYGLTEEQAKVKIEELYTVLKRNVRDKILVVRTSRTITFLFEWPRRHVQLILRLYKTPAEVLLGFDVDCVGFGYDGKRVYCLPRARRAINCRYNIADPSRQTFRTTSYEYRLWKYSNRGFAVAVPGLVKKRINPEVYAKPYSELKGFSRLLFFEAKQFQENADRYKKYYMQWHEQHGWKMSAKNYGGDDLSVAEAEMKIQTELVDYNEGILFIFSPYNCLDDVKSNLRNREHVLSKKGVPIPFVYGNTLDSVINYNAQKQKSTRVKQQWRPDDFIKPDPTEIIDVPQELKFIGSLTEYLKSLPEVEDDWWAGAY